MEGALAHLTRVSKSGNTYTRSILISKWGLKGWGNVILNNGKVKIKLKYFDPTSYYSSLESDTEGDYLQPVIVK
jgi:hypothetical protein